MNYGNIKKCDIANGPGIRVSLFVSGCTNHCKECFQPETWDFNYGKPFTEDTKSEIYHELDKHFVQGITILGGEPFEPHNQEILAPFLKEIKTKYPDKSIWCYTGFLYDKEILNPNGYPHCEYTDKMLNSIDILVDGRFDINLKNISLQFRGSSNQRIIDVQKSRYFNSIILWDSKYTKK